MGELRTRASRMEAIEDLSALKPIVEGLVERKLMIELTPPGRGQLVVHNLYPPAELAEVRAQQRGQPGREAAMAGEIPQPPRVPSAHPGEGAGGGAGPPTADLLAEIAELRSQVARLVERIERLESKASEGA